MDYNKAIFGDMEHELLSKYGITRDPPLAIHEDLLHCAYVVEKVWSRYVPVYPELSSWLREMEECKESRDQMTRCIPLGYRLQLLLARWQELGRPVVSWPSMDSCRGVCELGKLGQESWLDVLLGRDDAWVALTLKIMHRFDCMSATL